jgi:short subunit dehydrogenase-like uncharacterized protein
MNSYNIAVYGATGHTGRFVATELERRGASVRRIARGAAAGTVSNGEGGPPTWLSVSCEEPDALDRALEGTDAVINCAGPFLDTAPSVIESALRVGAHYLDIAAEQRSVRQSLATYREDAIDKGLVVLPAMAFYGGLADLLVSQLCMEHRTVEEVLVGVALDSWHPTAGTRRTGERNTARRVIVSGGRLAPVSACVVRGRWEFPAPFGNLPVMGAPASEIITISKHIAARRIASFINETSLQDLGRADTPPPTPVDTSGRSNQRFVMDVAVSADGKTTRLSASGRDIYAVSAPLVVEACLRVLSLRPRRGGTFAPAELFDPQDFLAALSSEIRVQKTGHVWPMQEL